MRKNREKGFKKQQRKVSLEVQSRAKMFLLSQEGALQERVSKKEKEEG